MLDIEDLAPHPKTVYTECQWKTIVDEFSKVRLQTNADLEQFRIYMKRTHKLVISNSDLVKAYHILQLDDQELKYLLTKKKNKSNSGVVVVTVLTAAHPLYIDDDGTLKKTKFSCAWDCHYCPNEKAHEGNGFIDQPRSYLFQEPAVLRANENNFDAILQFNARINTLLSIGHNVDKIELIILGGTWCSYPRAYQEKFITELYYAANVFFDIHKREIQTLDTEITYNENAKLHIIGLTLETRPDTITIDEIRRFRKYNATRIQLGVQHTDNNVLKKINRGHDIECVYKAIRMLKENGYKVDIHLMPNLPSSSYEMDIKMLDDALYDESLQADQLKIYPCAVVPFTKIKEWYDAGTYIPYSDDLLFQLLKDFKQKVQPYKRLNRIIRDIPSTYICGGYTKQSVNMRQLLQDDMKKYDWKCRCIRCREIKDNQIKSEDIKMHKIFYKASQGYEYFISYETDEYLVGFIRVRINMQPDLPNQLPILKDAALIRELHVYSNVSCVGCKNTASMQHKGYGKKLVAEAERIAMHHNLYKVAIISGTGVRNYYRKLGYQLQDTYMVKYLEEPKMHSMCTTQ